MAPKVAIVIYSMYGHVAKRKSMACVPDELDDLPDA
jgi:hypothetical protein